MDLSRGRNGSSMETTTAPWNFGLAAV